MSADRYVRDVAGDVSLAGGANSFIGDEDATQRREHLIAASRKIRHWQCVALFFAIAAVSISVVLVTELHKKNAPPTPSVCPPSEYASVTAFRCVRSYLWKFDATQPQLDNVTRAWDRISDSFDSDLILLSYGPNSADSGVASAVDNYNFTAVSDFHNASCAKHMLESALFLSLDAEFMKPVLNHVSAVFYYVDIIAPKAELQLQQAPRLALGQHGQPQAEEVSDVATS